MGKRKFEVGQDCPNCPAIWGVDEMQEERCFACGYPDHDEDDDWDDEDYDDPRDYQCSTCGLSDGDHSLDCPKAANG